MLQKQIIDNQGNSSNYFLKGKYFKYLTFKKLKLKLLKRLLLLTVSNNLSSKLFSIYYKDFLKMYYKKIKFTTKNSISKIKNLTAWLNFCFVHKKFNNNKSLIKALNFFFFVDLIDQLKFYLVKLKYWNVLFFEKTFFIFSLRNYFEMFFLIKLGLKFCIKKNINLSAIQFICKDYILFFNFLLSQGKVGTGFNLINIKKNKFRLLCKYITDFSLLNEIKGLPFNNIVMSKYWLFNCYLFNQELKIDLPKTICINKKFVSREKFRYFIKHFLNQIPISKVKIKFLVGNSNDNLIFFFNKILNKYWTLFFHDKVKTIKIGSFVLIMHKLVRWLKFKKVSKNYSLVAKWILKQLILFIKIPLIKNVSNQLFFWNYSIRWHFETYAWRKTIRFKESRLLLYFNRCMSFQLNILPSIKHFLLTTFNSWVLISRHMFTFLFPKKKNWKNFRKLYLIKIKYNSKVKKWRRRRYTKVKQKWNHFFQNFLKFFKKKYLIVLKFVWILTKLQSIFNYKSVESKKLNVISFLDTTYLSNDIFYSLSYRKNIVKLLSFFKKYLSMMPWKNKVKDALVTQFYLIIVFLKLIFLNKQIYSFNTIIYEIYVKLSTWILRATYWFKYIAELWNLSWYKSIDTIHKKVFNYKLQKKWRLWRLFKINIFWFRKGQPIKTFFRYNNILVRYYNFFYGYKTKLLNNIMYHSFISLFESKLVILLYRLGLSKNNIQARELIKQKQILINDKIIKFHTFFVIVGSIIRVSLNIWGSFLCRIPLGTSNYLKWSIINYVEFSVRLFGGLFFRKPLLGEYIFKQYEQIYDKFYLKWLYWVL